MNKKEKIEKTMEEIKEDFEIIFRKTRRRWIWGFWNRRFSENVENL